MYKSRFKSLVFFLSTALFFIGCSELIAPRNQGKTASDTEQQVVGFETIDLAIDAAHTGFGLASVSGFGISVACDGMQTRMVTESTFQLPRGATNCVARLDKFTIGNREFTPKDNFTTWLPPETAKFQSTGGDVLEARVTSQISSAVGAGEQVRYEIWGVRKSSDIQISIEAGGGMTSVTPSVTGEAAPATTLRSASYTDPNLELLAECDGPMTGTSLADGVCVGDQLAQLEYLVVPWTAYPTSTSLNTLFNSNAAQALLTKGAFVPPGVLGLANGGIRVSSDLSGSLSAGKLENAYLFALHRVGSKSYTFTKLIVNESTPTPDPLPPPGEPTVELVGDTTVHAASPSTAAGSATKLEVDQSPDQEAYLKFVVTNASAINRVVLRLSVTNGTGDGPKVYKTEADWNENQMTWDSRPSRTNSVVADIGKADKGTTVDIDFTSILNGDGEYSLALVADSTNGFDISSKEGSSPPQIILNDSTISTTPGGGGGGGNNNPDPNADPLADAKATRGPFLQMGSQTAMTVRWRTDVSTNAIVRYGLAPNALTESVESNSQGTKHEVRLTGLTPDTRYYYSIGNSKGRIAGATEDHSFKTFPVDGKNRTSRFWVIGDAGTANDNAKAVRDAYYQYSANVATDLWLMLGDNAYSDGKDAEYQEAVFDVYQKMLISSPLFPTRGNHERDDSPFYELFTMPTNAESGGYPSGSERYYSFDYGSVHFICLDSVASETKANSAMITWLKADLASTTQQWVVAYWHHSPYSDGSHDDNEDMRDDVVPVLEDYGVDLVLTGHSHGYERSYLLDSGKIIDSNNGREGEDGPYAKAPGVNPHDGAVYVVAGSSGKVSSGGYNHPLMYIGLQRLGSVVLDVSETKLEAKFLRENGTIDDQFTIIKQ